MPENLDKCGKLKAVKLCMKGACELGASQVSVKQMMSGVEGRQEKALSCCHLCLEEIECIF